ncbi:MAG: excinuclease ABC subunit UvrC [Nitrospinae bacterium]|nr:excinuclease ABC subunit UvrC [Nitrospinota bacterium]
MQERISEILKQIPSLPGIYIMKDGQGEILYIGKAKSLSNRVRSYFQSARLLAPRTRIFVDKVRDIKFLTTKTETEALILESNFIKRHKPRYNVLLKDDKHYPYLRLTAQELYPRLEVVRRVQKDGATYFGPYTMVKEIRETLRMIYKIFPLRQSSDELDGQPKRRPCLNYQMGRCLAPCAALVSPDDYAKVVRDVVSFLKGNSSDLIDGLKTKMREASSQLRYEEAAMFRDKIEAALSIYSRQKIISASLEDQDVVGYCRERGMAVAQILIVRGGKMIGEKNFKMKTPDEMEDGEVLSAFVKQYYAGEELLPSEIFIPHEIDEAEAIAEWLTQKRHARVKLTVPRKGKNRDLALMAQENASFAMRSEMDKDDVSVRSLEELQETLGLKNFPETIEGFDISNISGSHAVGSMVFFQNARPEKSKYRRYKIRAVQGIDDYAMLRETMTRRYRRLTREEAPLPDLILIDGGRGHLNAAYGVLRDLNLQDKIDLVCIAKGKFRNKLETDEVYLVGRKDPVLFRENSPSRFLLQRVRDEAHRFAVAYHRQLRSRKTLASPLEAVPGIGKKRRLLLLKRFGSLESIKRASLEELQSVQGITEDLARKIVAIV